MKKSLLFLLAANLLLVFNSIGQTFYGSSDVISYSSGKVFSNTDKTVKIEIGYDGIKVNGNLAYFNLEINVLSTSVALIKGYSLSNPDGTISFRINSSTGCIVQGGDSYCNSNSSSNNNSNSYNEWTTQDLERWKLLLPTKFTNPSGESITFNPDGTGVIRDKSGVAGNTIKWSIKVTNEGVEEIKITVKAQHSDKIFINESLLGFTTDKKASIYQWIDNKRIEWKNY